MAFHAGISSWKGKNSLNENSIGIELDNLGLKNGVFFEFSTEQLNSLWDLCANLTQRFNIKYFLGHSDIAPNRKIDPGPYFPWDEAAKRGFNHLVSTYENLDNSDKILAEFMQDKQLILQYRNY